MKNYPFWRPTGRLSLLIFGLLVACQENTENAATKNEAHCSFKAEASKGALEKEAGVGYHRFDLAYTSSADQKERTVPVSVWYPAANDTDSAESIEYQEDNPLSGSTGVEAQATAARPLDGCAYPVLIFSHGHIGWAGNGEYLAKTFAKQGWVVVAPDHVGNTTLDNVNPRRADIYVHRPEDIRAVLDHLESVQGQQQEGFLGKLFLDKVAAFGHSFGAYTMWAIAGATYDSVLTSSRCQSNVDCSETTENSLLQGFRDERIALIMTTGGSFDRGWYGASGHSSVDIPVLDFSGLDDGAHEGTVAQWESLASLNLTRIDIEGACHPTFETSPLNSDCELHGEDGYDLVRAYATAFVRTHQLGLTIADDLALLADERSISNRITVLRAQP